MPLSAPVELALPPASAQPIHSAPAGRYQERPCRERTQVSRDRGIQRERERERERARERARERERARGREVWSKVERFGYRAGIQTDWQRDVMEGFNATDREMV